MKNDCFLTLGCGRMENDLIIGFVMKTWRMVIFVIWLWKVKNDHFGHLVLVWWEMIIFWNFSVENWRVHDFILWNFKISFFMRFFRQNYCWLQLWNLNSNFIDQGFSLVCLNICRVIFKPVTKNVAYM